MDGNLALTKLVFENCGRPGRTNLGGAIFVCHGNYEKESNRMIDIEISHSTFKNCSAEYGAAICVIANRSTLATSWNRLETHYPISLENLTVSGNTATARGAIYAVQLNVEVSGRSGSFL